MFTKIKIKYEKYSLKEGNVHFPFHINTSIFFFDLQGAYLMFARVVRWEIFFGKSVEAELLEESRIPLRGRTACGARFP